MNETIFKHSKKTAILATVLIILASLMLASATVVLLVKEHHPTPSAFKDPTNLYDGYLPGATVTFHGHITVTNTVQDPSIISIKDLTFTDQLPAGLTYVPGSATSSLPAVFSDNGGGELFWNFGAGPFTTLQADGYQASVEFQATVNLNVADNTYLTNTIIANYLETITNAPSGPSTTDTIYIARPVLDIMKTCTEKIVEGGQILYTVTLTNTGHYPAENIEVTDMLPAGVIYTVGTATASSGIIDDTTPGQIIWTGNIPSVTSAPANVVTITIPVTDDATVVSNSLVNTVAYTEFPVSAQFINDDDTCTTTVIHPAIMIEKDASPAKILAGTDVTYTITVTNTGDVTLENVDVVDDVLGNIGNVVSLAPSAVAQFVVVVPVNVDTTNTATVTADYQLGSVSDSDTAMVDVINPAIDVTKTCEATVPTAPGTITWTITVTNTGDVDLNVVVDDSEHGPVFAGMLAVGQSEVIVIIDSGLPAGMYTNTVDAVGTHQLGTVTDSDVDTCEIEGAFEGLTPGFWKNHPDVWCEDYSPDDKFSDVFGVVITVGAGGKNTITDPTLMEALSATGGINEAKGVYDALARHAVAALLNACHPDVDYPLTEQQIITAVYNAITNADMTDAELLKNQLAMYNELGGGIDAHGNPI